MSETQTDTATRPQPPRRRSPWLSALLYLLLFGSGLVCGAGLTLIVVHRHMQQVVQHPEVGFGAFARLMDRRLHLTPTQRTQIRGILRQRQTELQRVRRSVQPQVEKEFADLVKEIDQVLTPGQQGTWHRMVQRMRRWFPQLPPEQKPTKSGGAKQTQRRSPEQREGGGQERPASSVGA